MASGYNHKKSSSEGLRKRKKSKIPSVVAKKDTKHNSHVVQHSTTPTTLRPSYFFRNRWCIFALLAVVTVTFAIGSILRMMVTRPIVVVPPPITTNSANNPPQAVDSDSSPPSDTAVQEEENDDKEKSKQNIHNSGDYIVLEVLPHDTTSFTQGLTFMNGRLYEGTGYEGFSKLMELDTVSGEVIRSVPVDSKYFGEGIAGFVDETGRSCIIQLTYHALKGFIYDANTFEIIREFDFDTVTKEGWGITYDDVNQQFVVSDGSHFLYFWDRDTLKETRRVTVTWNKRNIPHINELEFLPDGNHEILANVFFHNVLVRIDLETGRITQIHNFTDLYQDRILKADVFNGVSITDKPNEFWVTGKYWPHLYRIKLL